MALGRTLIHTGSRFFMMAFAVNCVWAQPAVPLSADEIVQRMRASEERQKKYLRHYTTVREYRLSGGGKTVEVLAKVSYDGAGRKTIDVIEERGAEGLFRRAIRKIIETEMKESRESKAELEIGPANYDFRLAGTEVHNGARCHVLELVPKRGSKYLLNGRLWVDSQDFAIAGIEGRPSANVSFWIGKPHIRQSFQKVGDVWLLARNEASTKAKIVGLVVFAMETREAESRGAKFAVKRTPRNPAPPSD